MGRPLPQTEVKIADLASGQTVAPGVTGELCTRGYHVMTGYFRDPEMTAAAIDADGWLHTGDLASMDERGYFSIAGRLKDMIIRGGENIYPRDRAGPVRAPGRGRRRRARGARREMGRTGRRIHTSRTRRDPDPGELSAYCREHLAPHNARATGPCWRSSRLPRRARCRNSCCENASSPKAPDVTAKPDGPGIAATGPAGILTADTAARRSEVR